MAAAAGVGAAGEVVEEPEVEEGLALAAEHRVAVLEDRRPGSVSSVSVTCAWASSGVSWIGLEVVDEVLDLLVVERAAALDAPRRHRRDGPAVGEDVRDLLAAVAQEDGVERRRPPVDDLDGAVGDRVGAGRSPRRTPPSMPPWQMAQLSACRLLAGRGEQRLAALTNFVLEAARRRSPAGPAP